MSKISMTQLKGTTLENAFERFIRTKKAEGKAESTIIYYQERFKKFTKYYSASMLCKDVNKDIYIEYINYLTEENIAEKTINKELRGVKAFFNYCIEMNFMQPFKMKLRKVDDTIKEYYTPDELAVLLSKPNVKKCSFAEYRSWAMINFFYGTGLRLSSVINIKLEDLHLDERFIAIKHTKSRKQQITFLTSYLVEVLEDYLKYRGDDNNDGYLFPNQFGNKLSKSATEDSIAYYNKKRGVDKRSIHLFRHTFAKDYIMNNGDTISLKEILGHETLNMVTEYAKLFGNDLKDKNDAHNPLENYKSGAKQKSLTMNRKKY